MTKFVGTVHDYTDVKLSQLTLPSQCVLTRVSELNCQNNIVGGQEIVKCFNNFVRDCRCFNRSKFVMEKPC